MSVFLVDFIFEQFIQFVNFSIEFELLLNIGMEELLFQDSNFLHSFLSFSFGLDIKHFSGLFSTFLLDVFVIDQIIVMVDNVLHFLHVFVTVLDIIF